MKQPISWLREVRGFMMRPAGRRRGGGGYADFMGPAVDANLDKFGAERIGDAVLKVGTADHAHLPVMHSAEGIERRAVRLPLAIFLDHADAERVERLFTVERLVALGRLVTGVWPRPTVSLAFRPNSRAASPP